MCLTLIQFAFSDCQGIVSRSDSFLPIRTLNGIPPFASLWFPRGFNTLLHRIWNSNAKKGSGNQENRGVKSARFNLVGFLRQSCWAKVRLFIWLFTFTILLPSASLTKFRPEKLEIQKIKCSKMKQRKWNLVHILGQLLRSEFCQKSSSQ